MYEPKLIVVRHGSYLSSERSLSEDKRPLSEAGKEEMKATASAIRALMRAGEALRIFSSPTVRGMQSAEIIRGILRGEKVVALPLLEIGSRYIIGDYPKRIAKFATNLPPHSMTIAVTHITHVMDIVAARGNRKPKEGEVPCGSGFILAGGTCTPLR
ncbi:MAG: hypothetical protein RL681_510 [Candidatus Parcubacteria bacterium]|jgi:phosphohistidine phosphatase SixA